MSTNRFNNKKMMKYLLKKKLLSTGLLACFNYIIHDKHWDFFKNLQEYLYSILLNCFIKSEEGEVFFSLKLCDTQHGKQWSQIHSNEKKTNLNFV